MVKNILEEWLSGEKTLPAAVSDWYESRTPKELVWRAVYGLLQGIVGSIAVAAAIRGLSAVSRFLTTTPPVKVLGIAALWVIAGELLHVSLTLRAASRKLSVAHGREPRDEQATGGIGAGTRTSRNGNDEVGGKITDEGGTRR